MILLFILTMLLLLLSDSFQQFHEGAYTCVADNDVDRAEKTIRLIRKFVYFFLYFVEHEHFVVSVLICPQNSQHNDEFERGTILDI